MSSWPRRLRAAVGMGLTWAVGWAVVGFAIELIHNVWPNPVGALVDIWPAALAYPAFFGGLVFSAVLGIVGRRHRFDQLSLPRFAAWGACGGFLLGMVPAAVVALGAAGLGASAAILGFVTFLTSVSASGSLLLARTAEGRELADGRAGLDEAGLTGDERRTLLGEGG